MLRNLKLGGKIGGGFAVLLAIMLAIGGMGVWNMYRVKATTDDLSLAKAPAVDEAIEMDRHTAEIMYGIRGYNATGDLEQLAEATEAKKGLREHVEQAMAHATEKNLQVLMGSAKQVGQDMEAYQALIDQMVALNEQMTANRNAMDEAAAAYMSACHTYLEAQNERLVTEIRAATGAGATGGQTRPTTAALEERQYKSAEINNVIDLGNAARVAAWKAQTQRDPQDLLEAADRIAQVYGKLDQIQTKTRQEDDLQKLAVIRSSAQTYETMLRKVAEQMGVLAGLTQRQNEIGVRMAMAAREAATHNLKDMSESARDAAARLSSASLTMLIGLPIATVIGVIVAVLITRNITHPVIALVGLFKKMSEGDLTRRAKVSGGDEIAMLARSFNEFGAKVQKAICGISNNASTLADMSGDLKASTSGLNQTAEEMAGQAQTAASGTEEASNSTKSMAAGVEQISANSGSVASSAEQVTGNLQTVAAAVEQMSSNMNTVASATEQMTTSVNTVASAVEEMSTSLTEVSKNADQAASVAGRASSMADQTTQMVKALEGSAQQIGKVVEMITSIASQTNLLALNATIEAASAGDAGKGFAVVANEVKELAKQTAVATEDIRSQVETMQGNTTQAAEAIENIVKVIAEVNTISGNIASAVQEQTTTTNEISRSIAEAADGSQEVARNVQEAAKGANEASQNVQEAVRGVDQITKSISELAAGAREVSDAAGSVAKGTEDVSGNVVHLSQSCRKTAAGATEAESVVAVLQDTARQLDEMIETFQVGQRRLEVGKVKSAHLKWRSVLSSVLSGFVQMSADEVTGHHDCEFGHWYEGPEGRALSHLSEYARIGQIHRDVHDKAREIVGMVEQGRVEEARQTFEKFEQAREELFTLLDQLAYVSEQEDDTDDEGERSSAARGRRRNRAA